jgi:hypothetical protein
MPPQRHRQPPHHNRLIDSYAEGLIEKGEFEPRVRRLRERIGQLEQQAGEWAEAAQQEQAIPSVVQRLEAFAAQVEEGLANVDWLQRRELFGPWSSEWRCKSSRCGWCFGWVRALRHFYHNVGDLLRG